MNRSRRGQSMVEYALIAVLVILGIVVMGPYVLRSINAHFKLWDEGVWDSFTEKIQQAPRDNIPDLPINCSCPVIKGSCGSSASGPYGCNANQREYDYNCSPQGCNGSDSTFYCVDDSSCCVSQPQGCGQTACPIGSNCTDASVVGTTDSPDCYLGFLLEKNVCGVSGGTTTGTTGATANSTTCLACSDGCSGHPTPCHLPACTGPITDANSSACPSSPGTSTSVETLLAYEYGAGLIEGDTSSELVGTCGFDASNNPKPCQWTCASGYIYDATQNDCAQNALIADVYASACGSGQGFWCDASTSPLNVLPQNSPQSGQTDPHSFTVSSDGYYYITGMAHSTQSYDSFEPMPTISNGVFGAYPGTVLFATDSGFNCGVSVTDQQANDWTGTSPTGAAQTGALWGGGCAGGTFFQSTGPTYAYIKVYLKANIVYYIDLEYYSRICQTYNHHCPTYNVEMDVSVYSSTSAPPQQQPRCGLSWPDTSQHACNLH